MEPKIITFVLFILESSLIFKELTRLRILFTLEKIYGFNLKGKTSSIDNYSLDLSISLYES
jgi:hypothetical protein